MTTSESPHTRSRWTLLGWVALVVVDGLFFLENTPIRTLPAWALWLTLAGIVIGVVYTFDRLGMMDRADPDGNTPLGPKVRWRSAEFWLKVAIAGSCGGLLALISPPVNLHWVHWVSFVPVFWCLRADRFWENFAVGWAYGAFALTLIFGWVVQTIALYSNIPSPVAFALLLLGAGALFGWLYLPAWIAVHPLRKRFGAWWVVLFPTILVAAEFFVSFIIIFPYQMGVAHYQSLAIWQLASVTGVWGVSWLVGFVNAALGEVVYRMREGEPFPAIPVAAAALTFLAAFGWGSWRYQRVEAMLQANEPLKMAQLQSPHDMVYRLSTSARHSFEEWVHRTAKLKIGEVDLAVWPEGASPYDMNKGLAAETVGDLARHYQMEMIVGGGTRERTDDPTLGSKVKQFNSVFYFDETGEVAGRYDKIVPLLFGEYLPWWLDWLHDYVQGIGSFDAGDVPVVFETDHGRMASPICYEAIFGNLCRQYPDVDLFVTVTNDAWFGDTAAPHQHGMLAALRATELGVPMVRSAYSGISFVVEPHGRMHAQTKPFEEVIRVVEVRLGTVPTMYGRFGDWFAWACVIALIGLTLVEARRSQTMSTQGETPQGSG